MKASIRWTHEEVAEHLRKFKTDDHPAVRAPDLESNPSDGPAAKNAAKKIHPRFSITVHHRSRRLADPSGRCFKFAVDGIVRGGILPDDSPIYVKEIRETFEQRKNDETIIEIYELI